MKKPALDKNDVIAAEFIAALLPGQGEGEAPPTFAEVAFAGRSNVGKSSLINCLLQRRGLVRTSGTPGCTRQINLFSARMRDGANMVLADLPGYGFAKRSKGERSEWATLIERYVGGRVTLAAMVLLIDARRGVEEDDLELLRFAKEARSPGLAPLSTLGVATKIDRLPKSSARATLSKLSAATGGKALPFSSVTGEGRQELWGQIRRALFVGVGEAATLASQGE